MNITESYLKVLSSVGKGNETTDRENHFGQTFPPNYSDTPGRPVENTYATHRYWRLEMHISFWLFPSLVGIKIDLLLREEIP